MGVETDLCPSKTRELGLRELGRGSIPVHLGSSTTYLALHRSHYSVRLVALYKGLTYACYGLFLKDSRRVLSLSALVIDELTSAAFLVSLLELGTSRPLVERLALSLRPPPPPLLSLSPSYLYHYLLSLVHKYSKNTYPMMTTTKRTLFSCDERRLLPSPRLG